VWAHNPCNLSVTYSRNLTKTDVFHQFPRSFDRQVMGAGRISKVTGNYVQWILEGTVNGTRGIFEVGGVVKAARTGIEITHRFFRPF
jgi:hypothetical protein